MNFQIQRLYAFVATDPADGEEGVIAFLNGEDQWVPMVAADETRLEQLRPMAQKVASEMGIRVEVVSYVTRQHLDWIEP